MSSALRHQSTAITPTLKESQIEDQPATHTFQHLLTLHVFGEDFVQQVSLPIMDGAVP